MTARSWLMSLVVLAIMLFDLWLGIMCIRAARHPNPFSIPFLASMTICSLSAIVAVIYHNQITRCIQNSLYGLAVVAYVLLASQWHSDDDGAGTILMIIVGPSLFIPAIVFMASALRIER